MTRNFNGSVPFVGSVTPNAGNWKELAGWALQGINRQMRTDGRKANELRKVILHPNYLKKPAGSCLIEMGNTRVVCSAIVEETVPPFLKGTGQGWLTAEYAMLPGSSTPRIGRERKQVGGRTQEIQRLIGRSLRSIVNMKEMGERSILIDCDVIDADGGTRTAAITGSYVALVLAVRKSIPQIPRFQSILKGAVAAVSVGLVKGEPCLDLCYEEDKDAGVDMNVVRTSQGQYVEVQGTGEGETFGDDRLADLLALAREGIAQLFLAQNKVLG